jgi:hypothetical protein
MVANGNSRLKIHPKKEEAIAALLIHRNRLTLHQAK